MENINLGSYLYGEAIPMEHTLKIDTANALTLAAVRLVAEVLALLIAMYIFNKFMK